MTKQDDAYDSVLKAWTDAQKNLFGVWSDWLNTGSGSMSALLGAPFASLQPGTRSKDPGETVLKDRTAADYLGGQNALKELIELSLGVWKAALSSETESENWAERAQDFAYQWIDNNLKTLLDFGDDKDSKPHMWKLFLGQLPLLPQTLFAVPSKSDAEGPDQELGHHPWLTLQDGWDPLPWLAGEVAELPHVGAVDTSVGKKLLQGFENWYAFISTERKLQLLRLKAWNEIVMRGSQRLVSLAQTGQPITTSREWLLFWIDTGDDVLIDMYRSDEYLKIQRELMTATMSYKKWLQEFGGMILEAYGSPTRAELDDAYRSIYELRREVRALKKDLRAFVAAAKSQPKTTSRRKKSTQANNKRAPSNTQAADT